MPESEAGALKHLGDIAKVHGGDIAPVDVITFGSPCQDLSVAGGQKGMKYVCPACGVEFAITAGAASCPMCGTEIEKTRSGLFIEAVRIIKEMRKKTNGKQPRFAVWENVPGAFSSNKGADFQIVLLELCRVTEPKAPAIAVPKGGWPNAGCLTDVAAAALPGEPLTLNFTEYPNAAVGSSLSAILQDNVPDSYSLSPAACRGILRRAFVRGKPLPEPLLSALIMQANR